MKKTHILAMTTFWIAAMSSGCGHSNAPATASMTPMAGAGSQTTGVNGTPSAGAGGATVSGTAGSSGSPSSMTGATAGSGAPGVAGSTGAAAGNAGSNAAMGGSGGAAGAPSGPGLPIPAPMSAPLIWGFGIGITDMPAAVKFYTEVMKMTVEKDAVKRDDRTETILYGTQAMRGARLVLMKFDDMRNTRMITAKVVWQAADAAGVNQVASMYPDYVSRLNIGIVQFDGPETYIQEVGSIFDDGGGSVINVPYPVAVGFAVSDQPASIKFYDALGMTETSLGSFSVTDATGAGTIGEYTVKFADGMGAVVQQWTPMRNAKDNPVKVVIFVPDAKAMADKVVAAGGMIVKPAERTQVYDNRLLVVAKDLDGYILEIVE